MTFSYLEHVTLHLAEKLSRLPEDFRKRHASYLSARQNADGGFSGREGESDIYYTAFALRGLALLGELDDQSCSRAGGFFRASLTKQTSVVDFYSFLYGRALIQICGGADILADSAADWPQRVAQTLESFRTADGGYGKTAGAVSGSTYHTFLVGLCYQLLDQPWPGPESLAGFVLSRQRPDGGFVEIPAMRRSGTNPTAAAVGSWHILHGLSAALPGQEKVVAFLARLPSLEGGFRANDRIPLADLLSTFTGTWTLEQLGALAAISAQEVLRYAQGLEAPEGGFHAGLWDEHTDVEYTFYGLGTVALLSS